MRTFVDLFCGIGGFHYAARGLGLRCVFACDVDARARAQYERNFGVAPAADITKIDARDIPDHDLLLAGFPCQPFSIIGSRKGEVDPGGTLFHDVLRVLAAKRPGGVVLENVRQFTTLRGGTALHKLLAGLAGLGYGADWRILNALDFGLPQKRERVFIVGMAAGLAHFKWPQPEGAYTPLSAVLEPDPGPRHFVSPRVRTKRHAAHKPAITPSVWHENKSGTVTSHPFSCALRAGASHNYLLVDGERRLTPREQLRLQGFPESFDIIGSDTAVKKQAGNAVPVPMARAVIREVLAAVSKDANRKDDRHGDLTS